MKTRLDAEAVKAAASIETVIGGYLKLQRAGAGELVGLCPFHEDKTPSFTVTPSKGMYHCFGCQASGDVFSFVQATEGGGFGEAVAKVAELIGYALTDAVPTAPRATQAASSRVVATYSYTDEAGALLYEVQRVEPGRNGKAKDFRQRRKHPMDGAWVHGIKAGAYRQGSGGDWFPVKGGDGQEGDDELPEIRRVLYRLPEVMAADEVWLVEGEKDVETLRALGVVATTNSGGAANDWLPEYTQALAGKRVFILPDNDEPGIKRAERIAKALRPVVKESFTTQVPTGKDITDFLKGGGKWEEILARRDAARSEEQERRMREKGLLTPSEILDTIKGGFEVFCDPTLGPQGLMTGFTIFDKMTFGLHGGELIVLAARPAMGKTAMALNIGDHVASQGSPVAVFSLEMSRESLLMRLVCSKARVSQSRYRAGVMDPAERNRFMRALDEVCRMPLLIDDNPGSDLALLRKKIKRMRDEVGLELVIIDYLQLMGGQAKQNRSLEVGDLSRGLKLMARELGVPFLVLSQLSRAPETRPGNHRPLLSDLRESGSIEQDADMVCFIFREEVYKTEDSSLVGLAELIVAKQRNGPTGTVKLSFLNNLTRFENLATTRDLGSVV
jgi:replicative DNA helicase